MQQCGGEEQIGSRLQLEMDVGQTGRFALSGIDDQDLHAARLRTLQTKDALGESKLVGTAASDHGVYRIGSDEHPYIRRFERLGTSAPPPEAKLTNPFGRLVDRHRGEYARRSQRRRKSSNHWRHRRVEKSLRADKKADGFGAIFLDNRCQSCPGFVQKGFRTI